MDDYCYAKMATIKTNDEDVQQLIGHSEELSTQSEEGPYPPHMKKEEEDLCITPEGECLLGQDEADLTKLPLTGGSVKTEDDEEKPQPDKLLAPLSAPLVEYQPKSCVHGSILLARH
ncbi:uncharacterized protein LOC133632383 isoform X3 [Entelurus aequoreus]|uniref:uncharacterized protein LOC133632383 isoform X3 n=1 Tax=Entelurus aequoreus TaxID=161455 RepID=UPI002B1DE5D7|nr:uncharacterized protein LOC133632383 isoform X3 [Entelurus aequoreus]